MSDGKQFAALPGHPDRKSMVKAAIYMERQGFTYDEWGVMSRLSDSSADIRGYILNYTKNALDMWDGLEPTRGHSSGEIGFIAAYQAMISAYAKLRKAGFSEEYVTNLLEPPPPMSAEEREYAWKNYSQRHPSNVRVTAPLLDALEQAATGDPAPQNVAPCEPCTRRMATNCKIIVFPRPELPVEWRIEVNSRDNDSATCHYIPAGTHRIQESAYWLLWVHATAIDHVPALVEKAKQLLKVERAVKVSTVAQR